MPTNFISNEPSWNLSSSPSSYPTTTSPSVNLKLITPSPSNIPSQKSASPSIFTEEKLTLEIPVPTILPPPMIDNSLNDDEIAQALDEMEAQNGNDQQQKQQQQQQVTNNNVQVTQTEVTIALAIGSCVGALIMLFAGKVIFRRSQNNSDGVSTYSSTRPDIHSF